MGSMFGSLMGMIFIIPMGCWMNAMTNLLNPINSKSCLKLTLSTEIIRIKTLSKQTCDQRHTLYLPTIAHPHVHDIANGNLVIPNAPYRYNFCTTCSQCCVLT